MLKDVNKAKELEKEIRSLLFTIVEDEHGIELWIAILYEYNNDFDSHSWIDKPKARSILNSAMNEAASNPKVDRIKNYVHQLFQLLPKAEKGRDDILGKR